MNLRSVNLNLLPILQALLRERSVAKAAARLSLSPSATSEALGRLRDLLGDSLLVQVGRSMTLTPFAAELVDPVEQLCTDLDVVLRRRVFDPKTAEKTFRIGAVDYLAYHTAARTADMLHQRAPGVRVEYLERVQEDVDQLRSGRLDFIIDAQVLEPDLHFEPLWMDRLVVVFADSHPLNAKASVSERDLLDYPSLQFDSGRDFKDDENPIPSAIRYAARFQQLLALPLLALRTSHLAIIPWGVTQELADLLPLQVRDLPQPTFRGEVGLLWGRVQHKDPAHRWFRQILTDALKIPS